jgi:PadR family transcriptional regulator
MTGTPSTLLPGTLEMLILKVVSAEPEHGWGIGNRLAAVSNGAFEVNQGSLYPALQRLLRKGWIASEWRRTENGRRARYYRITKSGARQLVSERESWARQVQAVQLVLDWAT